MQTIRQKLGAIPRKWRRIAIGFVLFLGIVLITPALEVAYTGFVNPSTTGPIVLSKFQSTIYSLGRPAPQMIWCDLKDVSPHFLRTVWVAEDGKFFRHWGFDFDEISAAQRESVRTGKPSRGASTITQQCARSLFLWQGRSWTRKILEAYYTVWMELFLSKQRIFELYVNVIELGDGVYGIEAAAQHYFHKSASDLTKEEAASLVTIMPRPKTWDPLRPDETRLKRQAIIIERASRATFPLFRQR